MNTPQRPFHRWWLTVVRREYVTRVRRRAFLVATLLGPVLWVGLVAGLVLLTQSTESPAKVWVVDHDGLLTASLRRVDNLCPLVRRAIPSEFADRTGLAGR